MGVPREKHPREQREKKRLLPTPKESNEKVGREAKVQTRPGRDNSSPLPATHPENQRDARGNKKNASVLGKQRQRQGRQDLRERSAGLRGNTTRYNTSATVPPTPRILPRPPKPKVAKPTPKHPTDPALVPDMYSDAHSCLWHIKITVGVHKPHSTCQGSTKVIGHAARSRLLHVSAWRPPVPSAAKRRMPTALRKGCLLFSVAAPPRSQSRSSGSTSVQQKQKYRPGG